MIEIYKHLATSGERLIAYLIDILLIVVIVTGFFYFFLGFDGVLENYFSQKGDLLAIISDGLAEAPDLTGDLFDSAYPPIETLHQIHG